MGRTREGSRDEGKARGVKGNKSGKRGRKEEEKNTEVT